MAAKGPAYLHAVFTAEAEVLKANHDYGDKLQFPLTFVFPAEGTFWTEQPYCILDGADWVTDVHREAATIYRDYLLAREQQEKAVDNYLRPVDPTIPLHAPIALENGTNPDVTQAEVPPLASPSGPVADALIDLFLLTKKKATIVVMVDTSGSMQGDKITNAVEATANFLKRLHKDDEVFVYEFNTSINALQPSGRAGDVAETLGGVVRELRANGSTALYDAVCAAVRRANDLQTQHEQANEKRLYGIVILSDGQDTASQTSKDAMFNCLPTGEAVEGVKVFTIAYGADADKDLLKEIAERTNGKAFSGDPATIESVYLAISAEQ
jgi:Ca-activated chloride channel family protein